MDSQVRDLGNLTTIGGAYFGYRQDLKEEWIRRQKLISAGKKFAKGGAVNRLKNELALNEGGEAKEFYTRTFADGTVQEFTIEDYEKNMLPNLPIADKFENGILIDDVEGEYSGLHNFLEFNPSYISIFALKYDIDIKDWEENVNGECGTDEEVLENILGSEYRVFYNDENDHFEISRKKQKPKGVVRVNIVTEETKKNLFDSNYMEQ
jgi:hypothetical protein